MHAFFPSIIYIQYYDLLFNFISNNVHYLKHIKFDDFIFERGGFVIFMISRGNFNLLIKHMKFFPSLGKHEEISIFPFNYLYPVS